MEIGIVDGLLDESTHILTYKTSSDSYNITFTTLTMTSKIRGSAFYIFFDQKLEYVNYDYTSLEVSSKNSSNYISNNANYEYYLQHEDCCVCRHCFIKRPGLNSVAILSDVM